MVGPLRNALGDVQTLVAIVDFAPLGWGCRKCKFWGVLTDRQTNGYIFSYEKLRFVSNKAARVGASGLGVYN